MSLEDITSRIQYLENVLRFVRFGYETLSCDTRESASFELQAMKVMLLELC